MKKNILKLAALIILVALTVIGIRWYKLTYVRLSPVSQASAVGTYTRTAAASGNTTITQTLTLKEDSSATLESNYHNNKPPIIEVGRWEISNEKVKLTLTGTQLASYDTPTILELGGVKEGLYAIDNSRSFFAQRTSAFRKGELDTGLKIPEYTWEMINFKPGANPASPETTRGKGITLKFSGGNLTGSVCNQFSGTYGISNNLLQTATLTGTEKACTDKVISEIEAALTKSLEGGVSVYLDTVKLQLTDPRTGDNFSFEPQLE